MPVHIEPEVLRIILNPSRLYVHAKNFMCPEEGHFSETAAIIEVHGGEIEGEFKKNEIATFTIRLPLTGKAPAATPPERPLTEPKNDNNGGQGFYGIMIGGIFLPTLACLSAAGFFIWRYIRKRYTNHRANNYYSRKFNKQQRPRSQR